MIRALQATVVLLVGIFLLVPASADAAPRLALWIESEAGKQQRTIPCKRICAPLRRVLVAAGAPRWERWLCQEPLLPLAPFTAGASLRGRQIATFVPAGECGLRQWEMIRPLYKRYGLYP